jgi:hypothetical protein
LRRLPQRLSSLFSFMTHWFYLIDAPTALPSKTTLSEPPPN